MERQNVTISIPKDVLKKAKLVAVERNTSLSALITESLARLAEADDEYELAMHRHMALMERGTDLGTCGKAPATREDLHSRR